MFQGRGQPQCISVEATVTRADGTVERLGTVAFYHRSPVRRAAWRLGRWYRSVIARKG